MAECVLRVAASLEQAREIEMRIREAGVERERMAVLLHGLLLALEVLEQHGQVERQNGLAGLSAPIDFLGLFQASIQVQQATEIEAGLEMMFVGLQGGLVGGARRRRVRV